MKSRNNKGPSMDPWANPENKENLGSGSGRLSQQKFENYSKLTSKNSYFRNIKPP